MLPPAKPPLRAPTPELTPTWDHRVPRSRGGGDDPDNLVLACFGCNRDKGDRTEEEFRAQPGWRTSPGETKGVAA